LSEKKTRQVGTVIKNVGPRTRSRNLVIEKCCKNHKAGLVDPAFHCGTGFVDRVSAGKPECQINSWPTLFCALGTRVLPPRMASSFNAINWFFEALKPGKL